jgi:hypothetical protein
MFDVLMAEGGHPRHFNDIVLNAFEKPCLFHFAVLKSSEHKH